MQVRIYNLDTDEYYGVRAGQSRTQTWTYDGLTLSFTYVNTSSANLNFQASQTSTKYKLAMLETATQVSAAGTVPTMTPVYYTPTSSLAKVSTTSEYRWGCLFLVMRI